MVKCPECRKRHYKTTTFNFDHMDPAFYELYHRRPELFIQSLKICPDCDWYYVYFGRREW